MHVLALRFECQVPASQSLKAKRAVVRPVVDGLRHRFSVSVAEVDHLDTWQRTAIGVALVSGSVRTVTDLADEVERFVWSFPDLIVLDVVRTWLEE